MTAVYELTDAETGAYRLVSASGSFYRLDLTLPGRTLTRLPFEHDQRSGFDLDPAKVLRRDGEPLPLVFLDTLRVGECAGFYVIVRGGVLTWRRTSPIMSIVKLADERCAPTG